MFEKYEKSQVKSQFNFPHISSNMADKRSHKKRSTTTWINLLRFWRAGSALETVLGALGATLKRVEAALPTAFNMFLGLNPD